jgi:hypothetical protein
LGEGVERWTSVDVARLRVTIPRSERVMCHPHHHRGE